jgi:hypothetical protein
LRAALALVALTIHPSNLAADAPRTTFTGSIPSYTEAPVFYEFAEGYYGDNNNLHSAHEGTLNVGVMGVVAIDNFNWSEGGHMLSYWVAMENFRYLLPLIASDRPQDRSFVREWIRRWLDAHEKTPRPNAGAADAMSVGHRAMAFIWYLRKLHQSGDPDPAWIERIKKTLLTDQRFLQGAYGGASNHGFWEAMGLFETTRVHPDPSLARLALDRLAEMVDLSVSTQGLHMEHSPAYHFYVRDWLGQFVAYLGALDEMRWSGYPALVDAERRMGEAAYYLYDHGRNIPQIGDTDAQKLRKREIPREANERRDPVLYDDQAGYAVYKDTGKRYVVFRIQNEAHPIGMPFHCHDDVLAVYYSFGGEIIFSDPGRYSYDEGAPRQYYLSSTAHNTIVPRELLWKKQYVKLAEEVSWQRELDRDVFSASLAGGRITRAVEVPRRASWIRVTDAMEGSGEYAILWHLGPDVVEVYEIPARNDALSATYAWQLITRSRRKFELRVGIHTDALEPHGVQIVQGQTEPYFGWYSPAQYVQAPARVIRIDLDVAGSARVTTSVREDGF